MLSLSSFFYFLDRASYSSFSVGFCFFDFFGKSSCSGLDFYFEDFF